MANDKPYKQKISISIDEDVVAATRKLAEEDDRNFSQYINTVLKRNIRENEAKKNKE